MRYLCRACGSIWACDMDAAAPDGWRLLGSDLD